MLKTCFSRWPVIWVYYHHEFKKLQEFLVSVIVIMLDQIPQSLHLFPAFVAGVFSSRLWPIDTHFDSVTICSFKIIFENASHVFASSVASHPFWEDTTLLFNHGEVLDVFARFVKKFTGVHLDKNTNHAPNVGELIPFAAF